jgi:hypothetical protein
MGLLFVPGHIYIENGPDIGDTEAAEPACSTITLLACYLFHPYLVLQSCPIQSKPMPS